MYVSNSNINQVQVSHSQRKWNVVLFVRSRVSCSPFLKLCSWEVYREVPEGPGDHHGVRVLDNEYNVGIYSVPHIEFILHLAYRVVPHEHVQGSRFRIWRK